MMNKLSLRAFSCPTAFPKQWWCSLKNEVLKRPIRRSLTRTQENSRVVLWTASGGERSCSLVFRNITRALTIDLIGKYSIVVGKLFVASASGFACTCVYWWTDIYQNHNQVLSIVVSLSELVFTLLELRLYAKHYFFEGERVSNASQWICLGKGFVVCFQR